MENTITFSIVTIAIVAVIVGFSSLLPSLLLNNGIQTVFAQGPPNGFPENANPQGPPFLVPPDNVPPGPPENFPPRPRG